MSNEKGVAPMEEEQVPLDSPSTESVTMDWIEVDDEVTREDSQEETAKVESQAHPITQSEKMPMPNPNNNDFDDYSFGSSDEDDEGGENGLEKMADVTLETAFDISIVQSSIENSEDALELVKGRDVVMVVGKTGVGKSTLIQGIAGKTIHTSVHKSSFSGQSATKTVFDAQDALPNFEIGHAKESKTRSLNAFLRKDGGDEVVYLDSPGLEDTRGAEMDIATAVLLSQVAKRCKSLRFVVLIHCASLLEDRGKAFRSILQFANKFVGDFSSSRTSFMFLFTHNNEITGMADSSSDAKKRLQEEIIQTAAATNEEDILEVLNFVRKSLKKGYPFVEVLVPVGTNYTMLADTIETKLRGVSDLESASKCNLTLPSQLRLEVATKNLLECLKSVIQSSPSNATQAKEIEKSFHYLCEYIDVKAVREAAIQGEEVIAGHKKELNKCIDTEYARWTSSTADFHAANAISLHESLLNLQDFDYHFSAERWIRSKTNDVMELQAKVLVKASSCEFFGRELLKIQALAEVFEEYRVTYTDTCHKLMSLFEETVSIVLKTDTSTLHERPQEEVFLLIDKLLTIQLMSDFSARASAPEINLDSPRIHQFVEDLQSVIGSWATKATELTEVKDGIECLPVAHVRVLEWMKSTLRKKEVVIDSLDKTIESSLSCLESDVVGMFTSYCEDLMNLSFDHTWEPKLNWMRDTCRRFSTMQGYRWKEMPSSYSAVINKIKAVLDTASELETMAQVTKEHGMRSGERLGREFVMLKKCTWFDSHLPEGDAFVVNCCIAIELAFQARINEVSTQLEQTGTQLREEKHGSIEPIRKLVILLPELNEIDKFLAIIEESENAKLLQEPLTSKCARHLEDHTHYLHDQANTINSKWIAHLNAKQMDSLSTLAQKLDVIYGDANALSSIQSLSNVLQTSNKIVQLISDACQELTRLAKSELQTFGGDFSLKKDILTSIKACGDFSHIRKQLPDFRDAQHQLRDLVAREAQALERSIDESSEWDKIDKRIKRFQSAVILDEFSSDEVTARLNTLQRLREKKESQVDEHLQHMISSNNFKGMAEFLSPLATSKDQIKNQKFDSFSDEIVFSLNLMITNIKRSLGDELLSNQDTMESIATSMGILATAKSSLQRLLHRKLNLGYQIGQLTTKIDNALKPILTRIFESTTKKDFVMAAVSEHQATIFGQHLEKYVKAGSKKRLRSAKDKFKQALQGAPTLVDEFFNSSFEKKDDLFETLSSLRQADERDTTMKALVSLYAKMRELLMSKVRSFISDVRESMQEAQCFDDIMPLLASLNRQVSGSLKSHLPTDLIMDCDNLLDRLQKEKQAHDRLLEFDGDDAEQKLGVWAKELDKLKSPSFLRRVVGWGPSAAKEASYGNLKAKLMRKVDSRFNQAYAALKSRDPRSVKECIDFIRLVEKTVQKHVNVGNRLKKLREKCVTSFLSLCGQVKSILEEEADDAISRFEEKFAEYRGFVLFLPCILISEEGKREFALINQMLHESLTNQLDSFFAMTEKETFDFTLLRSKVLRLRKCGDFFADRVTLLNEEIGHEQWLDKIKDICLKYFWHGRDLSKLKDCVLLGVVPSATVGSIRKAYKEKAKLYHPDKMKDSGDDAGLMFRKIKDAQDSLLDAHHLKSSDRSQPFDEVLKGIGGKLRLLSLRFMEEQQYDTAEKLLFQLPSLRELDDLVIPKLKSKEIRSNVVEVIKGHVEKMRVDVDTYWSERKYKELNDSITDLKAMESHFKTYPEIFATSWNTGILKTVEDEIESLGQKAKRCISSHKVAKNREGDFRRFFIEMGYVLVELPSFKAFTKQVMSSVLESCLDSAWGYGFLFELGLSLQRGDDSSDDNENRVAQMLVAEFSHFKEVMTMTWNQETSHKPVEDVVMHIKGEHRTSSTLTEPMKIHQNELLASFQVYEKQYKSFLGEYIKPDADLKRLVQTTMKLAQKIKPMTSDKLMGDEEKKTIPLLLAGVFSLFTILKSGASYNRIEEAAGSSSLGDKLLMKPHNIQVLTLLHMFGCGKGGQSSLESQLMQIRTGEGKSLILGAAACTLALLGFRVRTVCYSEYLSSRDFSLFEDVFRRFGLIDDVKYSKITKFAEDSTLSKGNIRELTESLLRGKLHDSGSNVGHQDSDTKKTQASVRRGRSRTESPQAGNKKKQKTMSSLNEGPGTSQPGGVSSSLSFVQNQELHPKQEILLVDEVDVFFGAEFYGKTYNQVLEFREPEVSTIIKRIWEAHKCGHRLRLKDIKVMFEYKSLLNKMASFDFLLDNEISLMLNQVKRVDDVPYYLDSETDRIGYKIMDSISYDVTYGYATIFAYLKEADNLKHPSSLSRALVMPVSCGQFSYANINPALIMGVSGTLQAIGKYEKDVLNMYGLNKFIYVPSVYGDSNFQFDEAGEGVYFECSKSNFYHKISAQIMDMTKSKRAVIVFFKDRFKLNEFVASPTYRQLGRNKQVITEDMTSVEKEYAINKAATSGQLTLSTAVFGRGTDFFCKDEAVERGGGVHIIQTFLSAEISEEIQIRGRTARQGKKGSYQMILLDSDLESDFGVSLDEKKRVPKNQWYEWLCNVRVKFHTDQCLLIEKNLEEATDRDKMTHAYFDSLLACDQSKSTKQFKHLYQLIKQPPVPSSVSIDLALVIDITGSMAPYSSSVVATIKSLISGDNSLASKLYHNFQEEIDFEVRIGCIGFRDIDDGDNQFTELTLKNGSHFTNNALDALSFVQSISASCSGGFDLAEDTMGAIKRCASWQNKDDWTSDIKLMMLLTDAPAHGLVPKSWTQSVANADTYSGRHPDGLTTHDAVTSLVMKDMDLFFCSFNPAATSITEDELCLHFQNHPDNAAEHSVTSIPMVPSDALVSDSSSVQGGKGRHIIFVLDESGSMSHSWSGVVVAYNQYISKRKQSQSDSDLVSVVQFDGNARTTVRRQPLSSTPGNLSYHGGGTAFYPAAVEACKLARETPASHSPVVIFMSDGQAGDAPHAAAAFSQLNDSIYRSTNDHLELHVIAFGSGTNQAQLQQIAGASRNGNVHSSSDCSELASVFVNIAANTNVATLLESEIAKRISEAVSDKLSLEYFGS